MEALSQWWLAWCPACEDFAGPYTDEQQAASGCGGHDDRYHSGRVCAEVIAGQSGFTLAGAA